MKTAVAYLVIAFLLAAPLLGGRLIHHLERKRRLANGQPER